MDYIGTTSILLKLALTLKAQALHRITAQHGITTGFLKADLQDGHSDVIFYSFDDLIK